MARAAFKKKTPPVEYSKFKGINESVGETEIEDGELVDSYNFRITKNYALEKRPGRQKFINFGVGNVQGLWYGKIDDKTVFISCWNGKVYEYDMSVVTDEREIAQLIIDGVVTEIGTINDLPTTIFWFDGKLRFKNAGQFKEYDGTTYQDQIWYVPTIAINSPPTGGGTLFEEINLGTGEKIQIFTADGTALYFLPETNIDSDLLVITVNGVTFTETVDFTVNRALGIITFSNIPSSQDVVSITWHKDDADNLALVLDHKYVTTYGVGSNTNIFLFGNANEKDTFRFSGVKQAGYYPANSFVGVGDDEYAITDMKILYKNLIVFKEDATMLITPTINLNYATNTGLNPYDFGYEYLNRSVGNLAPGMVAIISSDRTNLISLDGFSFRLWGSDTAVGGERDPKIISDRLKLSLQGLNLRNAVTHDYKYQKELWVNVDDIVYIWNYGNNTMYKYTNINATRFIDVEGKIYLGTNGSVDRIDEIYQADETSIGDTIPCIAYTGFIDNGIVEYEKNTANQWVVIDPQARTSVNVQFVTDNQLLEDATINYTSYVLLDFNSIDFNNFSFKTNTKPQATRFRDKIKKFTYLQIVFSNDTNNESLTILKIKMQIEAARYSG